MTVKRGEVWLANLSPTRGSEQAGTRPVMIFHHDGALTSCTPVVGTASVISLRQSPIYPQLLQR